MRKTDAVAGAAKEGWTFLYNSPKWHYFRNGQSLCGRWMLFGGEEELEQGKNQHPKNCMGCRRKLEKELAALSDQHGSEAAGLGKPKG